MICPHKIIVKDKYDLLGRPVYRPCGQCAVCRKQKVMSLTSRANYEFNHSKYNSFITLTYDDNHLYYPQGVKSLNVGFPSLNREHLKTFLDHLRHYIHRHNVKNCDEHFSYLYCGEYGGNFGRPHYHLALIGLDFATIKPVLSKLWKYGFNDVKPLQSGGLRYIIKYLSKGVNGKLADLQYFDKGIVKPFVGFSKGFGSGLFKDNIDSINKYGYLKFGSKIIAVSPYYRDKFITLDYDNLKRIFYEKESHLAKSRNARFGLSRSEYEYNKAKNFVNNEISRKLQNKESVDILERIR